MAIKTGITWARSTRNFWSGCTKVGPGCDGCYAESFQRFVQGKNQETGQAINWGPGAARIPHIEGAVRDLRKWNRKAGEEKAAGVLWQGRPGFWPVFLNSQSDTFDNEVPQAWRNQVWATIEECTNLTFMLVTKRIGNVGSMVPARWLIDGFPRHVWMLATIVNQPEFDRDYRKLLAVPAAVHGISYEPAIGPVDFKPFLWESGTIDPDTMAWEPGPGALLRGAGRKRWIIPGGESDQNGHITRPFGVAWARSTVKQCKDAGAACFVKQLGSNVRTRNDDEWEEISPRGWPDIDPGDIEHNPDGYADEYQGVGVRVRLQDKAGADPSEWPRNLRVQEFPA